VAFPARTNIWKVSLQGNAILKQKRLANLFDLEQTCANISLKKNLYERAYAQNILLFISIYKNIQNILVTTHTLLKRIHICMLKVLCQNLHMSIFKAFCYQKLHTHIWSILLAYKIFCCFIHIYLYIYAHWWANLMSYTHLHLFEKEFSCHLSTLERQFPIIYIHFGKHSRATFNMCTFFERLLMLPTHKYTYFERHFYATNPTYTDFSKVLFAIYSHTLQGISMLYIFTYIHTIERYFPCYLDARYSSWGSQPKF